MGIRAIERLTGLHRDTVMTVLELAGKKCASLLDRKLVNLKIGHVQVDELWCFVGTKQCHNIGNDPLRGDQYTFLAIDSDTKLIVSHYIGKRDGYGADWLMHDLRARTPDRIQITTDGLQAYVGAVYDAFDCHVDFAQQTKVYRERNTGAAPLLSARRRRVRQNPSPHRASPVGTNLYQPR